MMPRDQKGPVYSALCSFFISSCRLLLLMRDIPRDVIRPECSVNFPPLISLETDDGAPATATANRFICCMCILLLRAFLEWMAAPRSPESFISQKIYAFVPWIPIVKIHLDSSAPVKGSTSKNGGGQFAEKGSVTSMSTKNVNSREIPIIRLRKGDIFSAMHSFYDPECFGAEETAKGGPYLAPRYFR